MCGIDNVPDRKEKCIGIMCNEVSRKMNSVYDNDVIGGTKNKIHKIKVSAMEVIGAVEEITFVDKEKEIVIGTVTVYPG